MNTNKLQFMFIERKMRLQLYTSMYIARPISKKTIESLNEAHADNLDAERELLKHFYDK